MATKKINVAARNYRDGEGLRVVGSIKLLYTGSGDEAYNAKCLEAAAEEFRQSLHRFLIIKGFHLDEIRIA